MTDADKRLLVDDVNADASLSVEKLKEGVFSLTTFERLGGSDDWTAKGSVDVDAAALAAIATFTGAVPSDATLSALPCEEQHRLAKMLAGNVGYELVEEPEHPDSPHRADLPPQERFFLSTDNDSHWYLVPVAKAAEWEAWAAIPEDDERAWEAPAFAKPLGGAPGLVTFTDPEMPR
ncbi:hypothetical protein [Xanthobacter aminoxidans]|uniref:hypothetical protein n=1 Tax=Xanthobacter aminoxidans TaxID=186280 RepID=UPI0020231138|nr:hypothetical protein [Xanthobacter aminoxidans]MCL8382119.1 hypothetical protein [Xanthobacter aminoxidans]